MEKDERLLPLPRTNDLQINNTDGPVNYSPMYDEDNFDERRSLREYFRVVFKRLPLILALAILVTAAAAFYMYRQPSQFMAVIEIIIEPRKPKPQANQPININFGNDVNYYNTQLQLLQNPDLMRDVVTRLQLYKDPNLLTSENKGIGLFFRSLFSGEKNAPVKESALPMLNVNTDQANAPQITLTADEKAMVDRYAGSLLGGLKVDPREKTNIVTISVQSTNPALSARVAETVGEVFIEQDAERETTGAKKAYEELTKSIEDLQSTIASQEVELINYMSSRNLPLQEEGGKLRAANLGTLSEQWLTAMDDRRKLEASYNAAVQANSRGEGMNIREIGDSKMVQDMLRLNAERRSKLQDDLRKIDKEIQDLEAEKAELLAKYTAEYVKVKQVEEKIASLRSARTRVESENTEIINRDEQRVKNEAVKGTLVSLKSQLDASRNRENQLRDSYMNELAAANVQGQAETQLTTLKRKIETNRTLLDSYTQQQKQRELEITGSRPDNIKIATHAVTPTQPIGPKRERNIFIAFLISLAAGIGLAFLLDYLDDSVKSSDDIGRHLGLPTLALIPHQTVSARNKLGLIPSKTNGNGAANSMALVALEDTRSAMAEAYRHLRTSLLFSSAGKPPQTILVTSSQPAEGKTTTAINTAITLAQSGADVVIIDCDLRRPRLHNHFGFSNTNGLTNYLSGEKNPDNLLKQFPELPKLKVITSGPIPPNPAELLSSNEMKNLLQFLKTNYKHVIIDSPPAISFTDAAILSTQVDGVVLVAMAGKSSIHLIRRFKHRLSNIGARIYGVVLNGIKASSVEYGYYGYGYTYYTPDEDDSTPFMEDVETVSSVHKTKS